MKKILSLLIVLFILCGCVTTGSIVSNNLNDFGTLNMDKSIGTLNYKLSSAWQLTAIDNGLFVNIPYDDYDFGLYITAEPSEDAVAITDSNLQEMQTAYFDALNENLEGSGVTSYAQVDTIRVGNNYGFVLDVVTEAGTARMLALYDDGYKYALAFTTGERRDMNSKELDFAYNYFKTLSFSN